jgi:hypothetical protein
MKVSLVAFFLLLIFPTAATSLSGRLRVASLKEAHSVDGEGFQGVDFVDKKTEEDDVPAVDLKDGRIALHKEENNDDKSPMKDNDYKQVILDLRGQMQERDATIEELRDELHMKELYRRPDLQGDHVEPVLRFAWKFVLLMQASSESLEKENKAEPLVIGSNDFVADHLARHKFLDDTIPKRMKAVQNQYKSQHESPGQFAKLKGVSGSFMSSRAGLHRPRPTGDDLHPSRPTRDSLHPQEMVSLIHGFVR